MCGYVDTDLHSELLTHRRHMLTGEHRLEKGVDCAFGLNPFITLSCSASVFNVATLTLNAESIGNNLKYHDGRWNR
jgi:hypothetical protein